MRYLIIALLLLAAAYLFHSQFYFIPETGNIQIQNEVEVAVTSLSENR